MSLAQDLLLQSRILSRLDKGKPKQANLLRAASAAYYAVFHLLVDEASRRISSPHPTSLRPQVVRAFQHGDVKEVCTTVSKGSAGFGLRKLLSADFSAPLRSVAEGFVRLQDERHRADYDKGSTFLREQVEETIITAEAVFSSWQVVAGSADADIFCAALLLGKRWGR